MNIHAGEFPVNHSKKAQERFRSPVVYCDVEELCAYLGLQYFIQNVILWE